MLRMNGEMSLPDAFWVAKSLVYDSVALYELGQSKVIIK